MNPTFYRRQKVRRRSTQQLAFGFFLLGFVAIGSAACGDEPADNTSGEGAAANESADAMYTCAMHPEIRQNEPGDCPICGMALVRETTRDTTNEGTDHGAMHGHTATHAGSQGEDRSLTLSPTEVARAHVRTTVLAPTPHTEAETGMEDTVYTGRVVVDESRRHVITSWLAGRVERLLVRTEGEPVRRGAAVARIYSPELLTAVRELQVAIGEESRLQSDEGVATIPALREAASRSVEGARERLELLGVRRADIPRLISQGGRRSTVRARYGGVVLTRHVEDGAQVGVGAPLLTIADLSRVWALVEVPEDALPRLRVGVPARLTLQGETAPREGTVSFVPPTVDPSTGRAEVRIELSNEDGSLRPGMTLLGSFGSPHHGEADEGPSTTPAVSIPASAPLFAGDRSVVFVVERSEESALRFVPTSVRLGPRVGGAFDGTYPVIAGLAAGQEIVIRGAFMLDAELSLQGLSALVHSASLPPPDANAPIDDEALTESLSRTLDAVANLSEALATDDAARTTQVYAALRQQMGDITAESEAGEAFWSAHAPALHQALPAFAGDEGAVLSFVRGQLMALDAALVPLFRRVSYQGEAAIHRAFCPMAPAMGEGGAYWWQRSDSVRNAYYGDAMLTCGSVDERLAPGTRLP